MDSWNQSKHHPPASHLLYPPGTDILQLYLSLLAIEHQGARNRAMQQGHTLVNPQPQLQ